MQRILIALEMRVRGLPKNAPREEAWEFSDVAENARPPWLTAIVAFLVAAAVITGWKHHFYGTTEHDQIQWDAPRRSVRRERNHPHRPLPPQIKQVVSISAASYLTMVAGLLAFVAIRALAQLRERDEQSDRDSVDFRRHHDENVW